MSVAVQTTRFVPTGKQLGALLVTLATPQLSLTPGLANGGSHAQVISSGIVTITSEQVITGGWLSTTTTCCVQVELLPLASEAVQTTKFVPTGKLLGALLPTNAPQLSLAAAVPNTTPVALHWPALAFVVTFAGQLMVGAVTSCTVTVAEHVLL